MLNYICQYILEENFNIKITQTFTLYCMCRFNPGSGTGDEYKASKNIINKPAWNYMHFIKWDKFNIISESKDLKFRNYS